LPDTFGKRQRHEAQVKKAAAREDRRVARNQRRKLRESNPFGVYRSPASPSPSAGSREPAD